MVKDERRACDEEAVENALNYAAVRDIWVSLRGAEDELELEIADLGVGFDVATVMSNQALGFLAMRERLALVGGEVNRHVATNGRTGHRGIAHRRGSPNSICPGSG